MREVLVDLLVVRHFAAVMPEHGLVIDTLEVDASLRLEGHAAEVAAQCLEEGGAAAAGPSQDEQQLAALQQSVEAVQNATSGGRAAAGHEAGKGTERGGEAGQHCLLELQRRAGARDGQVRENDALLLDRDAGAVG